MKTTFFCCILFHISLFCHAQDSFSNKLSVSISPVLVNVPPVDIGMQFGLQYRTAKWGFGTEIAFPFQKSNDHYVNMKYLRWGAEFKYFPRADKQNYMSLQFNYAQRNFADTSPGRFFRRYVTDAYNYESTSISSNIVTSAFKIGREMKIGKKFFIDGFTGLGIGFVMTEYTNIKGLQPADRGGIFEGLGIYSAHRYDKTITRVHCTLGTRLHYTLSK